MRCDVIAEGVIAAVKEVGLKVPLVVRLEGTNVDLGKKIIGAIGPQRHSGGRSRRRRPENRQGREGGRVMAILIDKNTKVIAQGFTGKNGTFHSEQALAYSAPRWSAAFRPAKAARPISACRFSTRLPRPARPPAPTPRSSMCRRRAPPTRSARRSTAEIPLIVCITEGIPVAGHDQGEARAFGLEIAPDRAELPRRHDRRRMQDRHHAGQYLQAGQCRNRVALRNLDL